MGAGPEERRNAVIERLRALEGRYDGTKTLYDPNADGAPVTSTATLAVEPLAKGRFVGLRYVWSYPAGEEPQEGFLLVGENDDGVFATWIDSWHNGHNAMRLAQDVGADGDAPVLRGTFPAPPGPDWGWTIALQPTENALRISMEVVTPDGAAAPAVDADFARSA